MKIFGKTKLEQVIEHGQSIGDLAKEIRDLSARCLRGKYENVPPEKRADQLRAARRLAEKMREHVEAARLAQADLEDDGAASEDQLQAQTKMVAANLDVEQAEAALEEARTGLVSGVAEIEEFYGAKSREARQIRKILGEFETP